MNLWQGRRVFITGDTGFKGGCLGLAGSSPRREDSRQCSATQPNLFTLAQVAQVLDNDRGDIQDYPKLEASLADFEPEIVFHLAAQPQLRRSYADPLGTYGTYVMEHLPTCWRR